MTTVEAELRETVEAATPRLLALSEADASKPPAPGKWSPKQVIGHLIDSASNNHQRFVRVRFMDDLVFAGYEQEAGLRRRTIRARRGRIWSGSGASSICTWRA